MISNGLTGNGKWPLTMAWLSLRKKVSEKMMKISELIKLSCGCILAVVLTACGGVGTGESTGLSASEPIQFTQQNLSFSWMQQGGNQRINLLQGAVIPDGQVIVIRSLVRTTISDVPPRGAVYLEGEELIVNTDAWQSVGYDDPVMLEYTYILENGSFVEGAESTRTLAIEITGPFVASTSIEAESIRVPIGGASLVPFAVLPINATLNGANYTIADESIAVVEVDIDGNSVIRGLVEGETELTLSSQVHPDFPNVAPVTRIVDLDVVKPLSISHARGASEAVGELTLVDCNAYDLHAMNLPVADNLDHAINWLSSDEMRVSVVASQGQTMDGTPLEGGRVRLFIPDGAAGSQKVVIIGANTLGQTSNVNVTIEENPLCNSIIDGNFENGTALNGARAPKAGLAVSIVRDDGLLGGGDFGLNLSVALGRGYIERPDWGNASGPFFTPWSEGQGRQIILSLWAKNNGMTDADVEFFSKAWNGAWLAETNRPRLTIPAMNTDWTYYEVAFTEADWRTGITSHWWEWALYADNGAADVTIDNVAYSFAP